MVSTRWICLLLALVGPFMLAAPADAYKLLKGGDVYRWPHPPLPAEPPPGLPPGVGFEIVDFSTIPYYDRSAFRWSVDRAARAWNRARTGYRFERVSSPFDAAVIVSGRRSSADDCPSHSAPGFAPYRNKRTFIREFPREVRLRGICDRYLMVIVAAHEFGHVLGLAHDDRRCAVMNVRSGTGGRFSTPTGCPGFPRRQWWRNPVRPDDIRGVKELFYNDAYDPSGEVF